MAVQDREKPVLNGSFPTIRHKKSPVIHKVLPEIFCIVRSKKLVKNCYAPCKSVFFLRQGKKLRNTDIYRAFLTKLQGKTITGGLFLSYNAHEIGSNLVCSAFYSVLSATTGSLLAATLEGIRPAITVSPILMRTKTTAATGGSTALIE